MNNERMARASACLLPNARLFAVGEEEKCAVE